MSTQSVGGIIRALLPLENQGGDLFFGEPALDIFDWIRTDVYDKGMINVLNCVKLVQNPTLYASFLLWMMAELFERLPEAGDLDKPKLVFFFDEAHMLFSDAPKVLVQKIEQMVKLIRSKGVGIYFVTQSPSDIPDTVLAQLSNRVQHALRAYTPAEQKAVRAAAQSFRANPAFKTEDVIMELGVGEALTSFLDESGVPGMAQRTSIICPQSFMGPVDESVRTTLMSRDGMSKYDKMVDNQSAYEVLNDIQAKDEEQAKLDADRAQLEKEKAEFEKQKAKDEAAAQKQKEKEEAAAQKQKEKEKEAAEKKKEKAAERRKAQIERTLISTGGQILKRGLLNTLFK
jgi:DNA helicase HerA-like ATPase